MANRNTQGFGLIPTGTVGSTPATAGQGKYLSMRVMQRTMFQGMVFKVKLVTFKWSSGD